MPDSICADIIYLLSTWISIITAFYKASRQPWLTSFHRVVSTGWIIGIVLDCIVYSVYTEYTRLAPRLWAFVLQEWKLRVTVIGARPLSDSIPQALTPSIGDKRDVFGQRDVRKHLMPRRPASFRTLYSARAIYERLSISDRVSSNLRNY